MSDQSDHQSPPPDPSPGPQGTLHVFLHRFGSLYHRIHKTPDHTKRHTYAPCLFGLTVAIGLPLMGVLLRDFFYVKLVIACLWFAIGPYYYLWAQGAEIDSQIKRFGLLDQQESDQQRRGMYVPFLLLFFPVIVWIVAWVLYVSIEWPGVGGWVNTYFLFTSPAHTPVFYGIIEWGIFFHTILISAESIDIYYPIMTIILSFSGRIRRLEQGTVSVEPAGH